MGLLVGDSTGNGFVNAGDALQTRNRSGQVTDATNFRSDVNTVGFVNNRDTTVARRSLRCQRRISNLHSGQLR